MISINYTENPSLILETLEELKKVKGDDKMYHILERFYRDSFDNGSIAVLSSIGSSCKDSQDAIMDKANKVVTINGVEKTISTRIISYDELARLVHGSTSNPPVYSCTYSKGYNDAQGILHEGDTIQVKPGMVFSIRVTGNA